MKIRVFFTNFVDPDNFNAQSLNVREIALRLNPEWFQSTLFYERTPDPRLMNRPSIRLVQIPRRLGTMKILAEFFQGQDIIFRVNMIRFTYLYLLMPVFLRRGAKMVEWFEAPAKEHLVWEPRSSEVLFKLVMARVPDRVAMTEYTAASNLKEYGLKSDELIPAGVDTQLFVPPLRRDNDVPVVLFVGTLIERKNPQLVLLAARLFPRAKFALVGSKRGKFHLVLKHLVEKWNLQNVTFFNPMPHSQLITLMQNCDILFHPSQTESIGKVILEAGATGMPALMLDNYRSPAVLDGVTGFQVKNMEQMLDRLSLLLEDKKLRQRMGNAAIDYAKKFDWTIITKQWERIFIKLAEI